MSQALAQALINPPTTEKRSFPTTSVSYEIPNAEEYGLIAAKIPGAKIVKEGLPQVAAFDTAKVIGYHYSERSQPMMKFTGGRYDRFHFNRERQEFYKAPRIYVWQKEETVLDNLQNRRERNKRLYRAAAMLVLRDMFGESANTTEFEGIKLQWSQYAGCSCPCSPGFILKNLPAGLPNYKFDIHIDIAPLGWQPKPAAPKEDMSFVELASR